MRYRYLDLTKTLYAFLLSVSRMWVMQEAKAVIWYFRHIKEEGRTRRMAMTRIAFSWWWRSEVRFSLSLDEVTRYWMPLLLSLTWIYFPSNCTQTPLSTTEAIKQWMNRKLDRHWLANRNNSLMSSVMKIQCASWIDLHYVLLMKWIDLSPLFDSFQDFPY